MVHRYSAKTKQHHITRRARLSPGAPPRRCNGVSLRPHLHTAPPCDRTLSHTGCPVSYGRGIFSGFVFFLRPSNHPWLLRCWLNMLRFYSQRDAPLFPSWAGPLVLSGSAAEVVRHQGSLALCCVFVYVCVGSRIRSSSDAPGGARCFSSGNEFRVSASLENPGRRNRQQAADGTGPTFSERSGTGPDPVLQCLGLQGTKVSGGVGHPIHSSAVSPQPYVVAVS